MSIELKKELIGINETICESFSQVYVEADVIVPDVKPDAMRILQVNMRPSITQARCMTNKVSLEGVVYANVIYMSDDSQVRSMDTVQNFTHTVNSDGITEDMSAQVQCEMENVEFKLLNSRKFSLKGLIGVDVRVSRVVACEIPTGIEGGGKYQTLVCPVKVFSGVALTEKEIFIKEGLEVPGGKASIEEILRLDVKTYGVECKAAGNKLVAKAQLNISVLYNAELEGLGPQYMEHELNFTEIIDIPAADDDQLYDIDFTLLDVDYIIKQDGDGDNRMLIVEANMRASVYASSSVSYEIMTDAYSIDGELGLSRKKLDTNELVTDTKIQITVRDAVNTADGTPEIVQLYSVLSKPCLGSARIDNGKVVVEGVLDTEIMYLSNDELNPIYVLKTQVPFSQTLEVEGANDGMVCDVKVCLDHISYSMNLSTEVDVRYVMTIGVKVLSKQSFEYIVDITESARERADECGAYCVTIYFASEDDSFWDIAKKYRVTIDDLLSSNGFDALHKLSAGEQVIIPA